MKHHLATDRYLLRCVLNGREVSGYAQPRTLLCDFLRHELGAMGTHVGCEHGVCGACTVRLEGRPARSCLTLAVQVDGLRVETVEGLRENASRRGDLQTAFRRHHALQCGFCTPGILMTASAYLEEGRPADEDEIRAVLGGHLCRCTGYTAIVRAVMEAATGQAADDAGTREPSS